MTKIVPYVVNDITAARVRAEKQLDHIQSLEHACHLVPLGQRLRCHQRLLDRHDLYIAYHADTGYKYPALYLIKKDHSRWARIWVCGGGFRLDADDRSAFYNYDYPLYDQHLMCRDLSIDLDIAEQAIVTILQRDGLRLGNRYLPNDLTTDLESMLPNFTQRRPAALPPPTIEAQAIEVSIRPVAPLALRPVALARKPLPRR